MYFLLNLTKKQQFPGAHITLFAFSGVLHFYSIVAIAQLNSKVCASKLASAILSQSLIKRWFRCYIYREGLQRVLVTLTTRPISHLLFPKILIRFGLENQTNFHFEDFIHRWVLNSWYKLNRNVSSGCQRYELILKKLRNISINATLVFFLSPQLILTYWACMCMRLKLPNLWYGPEST